MRHRCPGQWDQRKDLVEALQAEMIKHDRQRYDLGLDLTGSKI